MNLMYGQVMVVAADVQAAAKPKRRTYTGEYKRRILKRAEASKPVALLLATLDVVPYHSRPTSPTSLCKTPPLHALPPPV